MNIAFFCIPAHGHTNPTLAVVRELTARGHTVRYYTTEAFRAKVETAGAVFVPFDAEAARPGMTAADGANLKDYQFANPTSNDDPARLGSDLTFSTKLIVDLTLAADDRLSRELTVHRPDVIVGDSMAFWAKLAAKKHGIPFVSSTTTFAFNRFSAKVIGQNGAGFLQFLLAQPRINRQLKRLRAAGYAVKSVFDVIANDNETETVVYTSPEFQPCADTFSEKYHFVGPLLRPAQSSFEKLPGRSLIYISLGTVNNDALPFYRACLAAFGGDPRFQLVLSAGTQTDLAALGPIPENCTVRASVDQMAVLDCADVFLTHCGMNSASEGLWHGLPLVLYPQTPEQHGVANRVAALGAGVPLTDPSADGIRRAVETALTDPAYRENAQKLAGGFRRCGGAAEAADAIEHAAN